MYTINTEFTYFSSILVLSIGEVSLKLIVQFKSFILSEPVALQYAQWSVFIDKTRPHLCLLSIRAGFGNFSNVSSKCTEEPV